MYPVRLCFFRGCNKLSLHSLFDIVAVTTENVLEAEPEYKEVIEDYKGKLRCITHIFQKYALGGSSWVRIHLRIYWACSAELNRVTRLWLIELNVSTCTVAAATWQP